MRAPARLAFGVSAHLRSAEGSTNSRPVHKVAGVREVIEAAGAMLRYLPKYSPDLNAIEQAFSKLKAHLRKAAARTIPRLCRRIGALMTAFTPQECANYFRHAGYAST